MKLLQELGVSANEAETSGFPLHLQLGKDEILLDLPFPAFLTSFDPELLGVAVLDPLGFTKRTWGLAKTAPLLECGKSMFKTPLSNLMESAAEGQGGTVYLEGYRFFAAALGKDKPNSVLVLVTLANEEKVLLRRVSRADRVADTLKRLGKALTMNQNRPPMCVAAAHEIASTLELAAVLIWTHEPSSDELLLTASVGANRNAATALRVLGHSSDCAAELVASSGRPFWVDDVLDHVLTANLEARCCYLRPGGVSVHPLIISDRLLGVIEFVGRAEDKYFAENKDLFQTAAEHLSLALNSAAIFENFERWASHDALTGIPNHRALQEFLHTRLAEAKRVGGTLGALMIDVDHFKAFNEEEGHDAGDEVLKAVAEAIKASVRPYDIAARYGGEEFCVIVPNSDPQTLQVISDRIRRKVAAASHHTRSGRDRHITVSIGCAEYPDDATDAPTLLKAADQALFQAKREGRDRVVFFNGESHPASRLEPELNLLYKWLDKAELREAKRTDALISSYIDQISQALRLTPAQTHLLRALAIIAPAYQNADKKKAKEMHEANEIRTLLPSLQGLVYRYDGRGKSRIKGTRIPLLSRILAVLLALEKDNGQPLVDDPGRFDPEVVSVLAELHPAA